MNPQGTAQGISAPRGARGEGKLTKGIRQSSSSRARRPSRTKITRTTIRPVAAPLVVLVGHCAHISQNVARD